MSTVASEPVVVATIAVPVNITAGKVFNLLTSYFEGGIGEGFRGFVKPSPATIDAIKNSPEYKAICEELGDESEPVCYVAPLIPGHSIGWKMDDPEDCDKIVTKTITLKEIQKGLELMAEKHPRHFGDFIAENDDAITADVFCQLVAYGDVIFG